MRFTYLTLWCQVLYLREVPRHPKAAVGQLPHSFQPQALDSSGGGSPCHRCPFYTNLLSGQAIRQPRGGQHQVLHTQRLVDACSWNILPARWEADTLVTMARYYLYIIIIIAQVRWQYVSISTVTSWGLNSRYSVLRWIENLPTSQRADKTFVHSPFYSMMSGRTAFDAWSWPLMCL